VGLDLAAPIEQGVVQLTDFIADAAVSIVDLVQSGLAGLESLLAQRQLDRFDFNTVTPVSIAGLIDAGIAALEDLAFQRLVW